MPETDAALVAHAEVRVEGERERREVPAAMQDHVTEEERPLCGFVRGQASGARLDPEGIGALRVQYVVGLDREAQHLRPRDDCNRAVGAGRFCTDLRGAQHLAAGHVEQGLEAVPLVVSQAAAAEIDQHAALCG